MLSRARSGRRAVSLVCLVALATAGCSSSSAEPGAVTFFDEHGGQAARLGASVRAIDARLRALGAAPTRAQLAALSRSAQRTSEQVDELRSGWTAPENVEAEELPTIEDEISEGAGSVKNAMAALVAYAGNPSATALAPVTADLEHAAEHWNEGVTQLWHDAKQADPPTL